MASLLQSVVTALVLAAPLPAATGPQGTQASPDPSRSLLEGSVSGQVLGEGLEPVPGVLVELYGPALASPRSSTTDAEGRFQIGPVSASDDYRVRAVHLGYSPGVSEAFAIESGSVTTIEIRITREAVGLDTLAVYAAPLQIRRRDTEFGIRLDARTLELLPTPHTASAVAGMTPGARAGEIWGGAAVQANNYQLDGIAQNHPGVGGAMVEPSMRWVERVEIRGLGAGAEYGDFQGGMVNVVTRSGTNRRRTGMRVSLENHKLNSANWFRREIAVETDLRAELEGETSGPLIRDRLYFFVGGHALHERRRAQGHLLPGSFGEILPLTESRREFRGMGKLTWEPNYRDRVEIAGGLFSTRVENAGMTGYEAENAGGRVSDPVRFYTGMWTRASASGSRLEVRLAGFHRDERWDGMAGHDIPSVRIFAYGDPPTPVYQNSPFSTRRTPSSHTASIAWEWRRSLGGMQNLLKIGAEASRGSWLDRRTRNGGMTWRPTRNRDFFLDETDTWLPANNIISTEWGGEVDLDARLGSEAVFIQNHLTVSPRLSISPGLRVSKWRGDLLPKGREADRFTALEASGVDPRIGITLDPTGTNRLVMKAHWGTYHQGMLSQFFDRVEGGEVYSDRQIWYHRGDPPSEPTRTFTAAERDALTTGNPHFTLEQIFRLNETGSVDPDYRHPYVNQLILGLEASPTERIRAEFLYVHRDNRNLVALLDRNLADNYHVFRNLWVHTPDGRPIFLDEEPMILPEIHIPHDALRAYIEAAAEGGLPMPPGLTLADVESMSFEQDLVLTNPVAAKRTFHQLQFSLHASYPRWGASASFVWSRLRGNLNSVTGYEAGTGLDDFIEEGAGPFVRPNEQVNFFGRLPGAAPLELKIAVHADLGWGVRGGAFWHAARGDRYTAYFNLSGLGFDYRAEEGGSLPAGLVYSVAGQRVFIEERGSGRYGDRHTLDVRFDREIPGTDGRFRATIDIFNLWNSGAPTRILRELNQGTTFLSPILTPDPNQLHGAVQERLQPRTLRIGITADFHH
jgi:hypothetical protein